MQAQENQERAHTTFSGFLLKPHIESDFAIPRFYQSSPVQSSPSSLFFLSTHMPSGSFMLMLSLLIHVKGEVYMLSLSFYVNSTNRMIAAKFAFKGVSPTRPQLFSRISSFAQVRFQKAEAHSEIIEDEPLPFDEIPGPRGRFATAVQFYRQSDRFTKFHKLTQQLFKDYGPIYKENVTGAVHIMEPADIETVFRAEGKYPYRPPLDGMVKHREKKGQFLGFENM